VDEQGCPDIVLNMHQTTVNTDNVGIISKEVLIQFK
jgi:hypothetical protein